MSACVDGLVLGSQFAGWFTGGFAVGGTGVVALKVFAMWI